MQQDKIVTKDSRATVPTKDLALWKAALRAAGFDALDVGERITTDEGIDHEAVLAVSLRIPERLLRREMVVA